MTDESINQLKSFLQDKLKAVTTGRRVDFDINANSLLDDIRELERKAKALDEVIEALDRSYKDTYNEATHTTSFDVLDKKYLASEVEEILISYGFKKQRD
jgi:hypothetical protein